MSSRAFLSTGDTSLESPYSLVSFMSGYDFEVSKGSANRVGSPLPVIGLMLRSRVDLPSTFLPKFFPSLGSFMGILLRAFGSDERKSLTA